MCNETKVWVELTTLLIPGLNDSEEEIDAMSAWVARELGVHVPLHFTAFHPDYKMTGIPATPPATLTRARRTALAQGLEYVYTGNIHSQEGDTTFCPACGSELIVRDWYKIKQYRLTADGHCPDCQAAIAGHFEKFTGAFGRQRIPVVPI